MADQVQVLLEGMVGELEELRRKKVLSGEEIKAVLKRRRRFEFNVRKADTSSAEYLRYVDYERHLHLLLNRRCDQLALKRCGAIRFMGVERCRGLLERATRRFPAELQLWRAFIEFCLECCLDGPLGALFGRALQVHPLSAEFWIQAAMWEYHRNKNIGAARALFQRALRVIPEASAVWLQFFRLEMLYLDTIRQRIDVLGVGSVVGERQVHEVAEDRIDLDIGGEMEAQIAAEEEEEETGGGKGGERAQVKFTLSSAFMAAAVPKAIYRSAVAALPGDLQLRLGFVEGSRAFAGYAGFRSDVFAGIRADFAGSPEALDAWCRRSASEAGAEAVETGRRMALDSYDALLQEERYRQEPSSPLWDLYAAFLLEVCGQSPSGSDLHRLAISRLFSSFKHLFALSNQLLSQSSLLDSDQKQKQNPIQKKQKKQTVFSANRWRLWIDVLLAVGLLAEAQSTLQRAMEEHPADEALWLQAFRMAALRQPDTLQALLEELRALLLNCGGAETQWRLWRLYFARLVAHTAPGPNRLLKEMRRACCMLAADSLAALKPELLRILTSQGVDSAGMAGFYHFALQAKPNRLSFLQDCISWELCSASPEPLRVRRLFDVAVDECGSDHPSLWIDYIRFELSQDAPDRASALYWKARRTLLNPAVFVLHHSELTSPSL